MPRKIIKYNPKLKEIAKKLRRNSTVSEKILWTKLKGKQIEGYDFDRQKPIGNYIVDFFCYDLMLVIEIDGISHENQYSKDIKRHKELELLGLSVLRFDDGEVRKNVDDILRIIYHWIVDNEKVIR